MIPLADIKYVLLDMDGTLLDKYFDDFFWEHLVPEKYAEKHNITFGKAKEVLFKRHHLIIPVFIYGLRTSGTTTVPSFC